MRRKLILVIVSVAIGIGVMWLLRPVQFRDWTGRAQNVLSADTRRVLDKGAKFMLLSLDPIPIYGGEKATWALRTNTVPPPDPAKKMFHNYVILGSVQIRDKKERSELLRALYKGISDSDGRVAACFNPRHGISAALADETVDLVICFECLSIATYAKNGEGVLTTSSQRRHLIVLCREQAFPSPKKSEHESPLTNQDVQPILFTAIKARSTAWLCPVASPGH